MRQKFVVTAYDEFRFDPSSLEAQAGEPVQVTLKNGGSLPHDFTLQGVPTKDIKTSGSHGSGAKDPSAHAGPKEDARMRFTPTQKGIYEFYCGEPGHREAGMKGRLRVE